MKKFVLASTMLVAAGCSTQSPAPVIGGLFGDKYRVASTEAAPLQPVATPSAIEADVQRVASGYRVQKMQEIEPAAGPMAVVDTVAQPKNYGSYRMTQNRDYASVTQAVASANTAVEELKTQRMADIFSMQPAAGPVATPAAPQVVAPKVAASTVSQPKVAEVTKPTAKAKTYKVQRGDTLYSLARQYQTTVASLMEANSFTSAQQLTAGSMIMVPNREAKSIAKTVTQAVAPAATAATVNSIEPAAGKTSSKVFNSNDVTMVSHSVQKGENLYRIGLKYKVSVIDLMTANEFAIPQDLKAGMTIQVPLASSQPAVVRQTTEINQVAARAKGMVWPAKGSLLSSFGQKGNGVTHTGVAIKLPKNTPVMAAESGEVIYADAGLKSYGNLVLVRHSDGLVTAYAHNNSLKVAKGDKVKKGQTIALSGATGNVTVPQLHFEVRRNARAIDPTSILPKL